MHPQWVEPVCQEIRKVSSRAQGPLGARAGALSPGLLLGLFAVQHPQLPLLLLLLLAEQPDRCCKPVKQAWVLWCMKLDSPP